MAQPLMPHATAAWLVENTSLTFEQIAEFCGLHILEVQAIADDTAATKLTGRDPIRAGELTHEEIEKGQDDPEYRLKMHKAPEEVRRTKGPRYTPVQQAPGQARRHRLDHQEPPRGQRRPDRQADRHDPHDHRRDPRAEPLEHGEHHAEGPGDAGPYDPARARRSGGQGGQGGGYPGADRYALRRRPRGADRASFAHEREQHAREAEAALADAGDEALRDEIVPGIRDPFKNTPSE